MDISADRTTAPQAPGSPPAQSTDLTGRTLGDFHCLRRLGQGGMGHVYLAEQVSLKRKVALKLLKPELAANPSSLARFKKEAEAVARATHANIVQIYFIGEADGMPYMALEYVEGRNLREHLERKGPPDLRLALSVMRQVAEALKRACELGIVHRDIKPENILLTDQDAVKVADFGLSRLGEATAPTLRLTPSGDALGTPLYMSPEQVEGRAVDHRTDIYSFGVTCYHMLAGEPPFTGATPYEVAFQHVQGEARPLASVRPDLPPGLCDVIHKMMEKAPADRFQTAGDLLDAIFRLEQGEVPVTAPARRRSRRIAWLFAASILLAALAGAGYAWHRRHDTDQPAGNGATAKPSAADLEVERILPSQRREQALRDAVEQYLDPADKVNKDADTGCRLCRDLGVTYLDNGRLDEAEKLFGRMEKYPLASPYHALGKLGMAVVLALTDRPVESNQHFVELTKLPDFRGVLEFWLDERKPPGRKPETLPPALEMWSPPALRYWVVQGLRYNEKNGLPDKVLFVPIVPEPLQKLRQKKMPVP
jgi:serine/threonine-protein kinase